MFKKWEKKPPGPPGAGLKRQSSYTLGQRETKGGDAMIPSASFHDFSGHIDKDDEETINDLKETITNLKLSLQSHAESKAETMEHFETLKKAHDALFEEHQALQEQMDDAVELLKFMKEDKVGNEEYIEELKAQVEELERRLEGSVVSATIEGLTKDKMELQNSLKQCKEEIEDLQMELRDAHDLEAECELLREKLSKMESGNKGGNYKLDNDPALASMSGDGSKQNISQNEDRINELETRHEEAMRELREQHERELAGMRQRHEEELKELRQRHEEDLGESRSRYDRQLEVNQTYFDKIRSQDQQLSEAQERINQLQQEYHDRLEENEKVKKAMENLLGEKDDMTARLEIVSHEKSDLEEKVASLQLEITNLREHGADEEDLQTERENSYIQQLKEKAKLQRDQQLEIDRLNDELSTSISRIAQLQRELNSPAKPQSIDSRNDSANAEKLLKKNEKLTVLNGELTRENEAMVLKIEMLEEQLRAHEENDEQGNNNDGDDNSLSTRRQQEYQQPSQSSTERADNHEQEQELIQCNESLRCQIQILEYQLQEQEKSSQRKELRNAELEKEMQERLAKRLATQMAEIEKRLKRDIEKKLRKELEKEYEEKQEQVKPPTRSRSLYVPGEDESVRSTPPSENAAIALMEKQLRQQLQQVKEEREQWHAEQEQFQHKVLLSQNQLEKVREGYMKKAEKDRQRARDLEESNREKDLIIDRLNGELQVWKKGGRPPSSEERELRLELEELREQQLFMSQAKQEVIDKLESELRELQDQLTLQSENIGDLERQLEEQSEEMEEKYSEQVNQLQDDIDYYQQMEQDFEDERKQWDEEKRFLSNQIDDYDKKYKNALDKLDEFSKRMMAMESANAEELLEQEKAHTRELQKVCSEIETSSSSALEKRLSELREELVSCHEQQMEQLRSHAEEKHAQEIDRLESELREKHSAEVDNLKGIISKCKIDYSELEEAHGKELECAIAQAKSEVSRTFKEKLEQMVSLHAEQMEKLKLDMTTSSLAQIEEIKSAAETNRLEEIERMKAELNTKHAIDLDKLRESIRSEAEKAQSDAIESMRHDLKVELDRSHNEEIEKLNSTIRNLSEELKAANGMRGEIKQLQLELENAVADKANFVSQIDDYENALNQSRNKVDSMQAELDELRNDNSILTAQIASLEETVKEVDDLRDEVEQLNSAVDDANREKKILDEKWVSRDELVRDSQRKIESLNMELNELKEINSQLNAQLASVQTQGAEVLDEKEALHNEICLLQSAHDKATEEKESFARRAEVSEETIRANENEIKVLQTKLREVEEANTELEAQLNSIETKNAEIMQEKEKSVSNEISLLQSKLVKSVEEKEAISRQSISHQEAVKESEIKIEALQDEVEELIGTNAELTNQLTALEEQKAKALNQKEAELRLEIESLQSMLEESKNSADCFRAQSTEADERIRHNETTIESLRKEVEQLRVDKSALTSLVASLETQNADDSAEKENYMRHEIEKLKSVLEETKQEKEVYYNQSLTQKKLMAEYESEMNNLRAQLDDVMGLNTELSTRQASFETLIEKEGALRNEVERLQSVLDEATKENEALSSKTVSFENAIEKYHSEIENLDAKVKVLSEEKLSLLKSLELSSETNSEDKLCDELEHLQSSLNDAIEEREAIAKRVLTYEESKTKLDAEIETLTTKLDKANDANSELNDKITSLETNNATRLAEVEGKLHSEMKQLQTALNQANVEKDSFAEQCTENNEIIRENDMMITSLQEDLARMREVNDQLTCKLASLEAQSDPGMVNEADELQGKVEKLQSCLVANEEIVEKLRASNDHLTNELNSLKAHSNSTIVDELQRKVEQLQSTLDNVYQQKESITNDKKKIENLELELEKLLEVKSDEQKATATANELQEKINRLQDALDKAVNGKESSSIHSIDRESIGEESQAKFASLRAELETLQEENVQLTKKLTLMEALSTESTSSEQLMKDLAEVNANFKRLQEDHQKELEKIKNDLAFANQTKSVLEEAVEDIQIEKEDLEAENEELVSKLADLTSQAKTMLIRNDEMENQLNEVNMNFEERVGELENELESLRRKHRETLQSIQQSEEENVVNSSNDLEEENLELRQAIHHLTAENNAAREIKSLVFELREKNVELAESLRASRDQKKVALSCIEDLKEENEVLRSELDNMHKRVYANAHDEQDKRFCRSSEYSKFDNDGIFPHQDDDLDAETSEEMKAQLQHYKAIINQMTEDRAELCKRLSVLMDAIKPSTTNRRDTIDDDSNGNMNLDASVGLEKLLQSIIDKFDFPPENRHDKVDPGSALVVKEDAEFDNSHAIVSREDNAFDMSEVEETIRTLTYENGQLAQRLGGAVAEKEFAMTTLSKIGAKMEELMERNKFLESMIDVKSSHGVNRGPYRSPDNKNFNGHGTNRSMVSCVSSGTKSINGQGTILSAVSHQSKDPTGISMTSQPLAKHKQREEEKLNASRDPKPYDESNYEPSVYSGADNLSYYPEAHPDDPTAVGDMESTTFSASPLKRLDPETPCSNGKHDENAAGKRGVQEDHIDESSTVSSQRRYRVPGGEYTGQVNAHGQKHGTGIMKYENGNEYDGEWLNNKRDGKGTNKYASGNVYIGAWKAGKRHGFGVFHIKKTGDVYRGNWENGFKSGPGVYEYADGEIDVSFYSEDVRVGEGVRWSANRHQASRLVNGQLVGEEGGLDLDTAKKLTTKLGFVV